MLSIPETGANSDGISDPFALAARAGETLLHTSGGAKLHVRGCSHFYANSELLVSEPADAALRQLCVECAAELSGRGRVYFEDLDRAMESFGVPVESRGRIRELVSRVDPDRVWIPDSRSYIALGKDGVRAVYIGKSYVWIDGETVTLPGYAPGGGGTSRRPERDMPACPTCGYLLLATGECGYC